jgi:hypothetical protein
VALQQNPKLRKQRIRTMFDSHNYPGIRCTSQISISNHIISYLDPCDIPRPVAYWVQSPPQKDLWCKSEFETRVLLPADVRRAGSGRKPTKTESRHPPFFLIWWNHPTLILDDFSCFNRPSIVDEELSKVEPKVLWGWWFQSQSFDGLGRVASKPIRWDTLHVWQY